ncbi:tumor necrosis factor receptor superfamily member 14 [Falco biarmicus]|uniref:tumor necrosis factor receptor superfamily member 14 n=1 Tax=Falco rusticolus TaxID=120794 RepID=UPI0018866155|nr:tumor necrosis factor receptor superfamily member 14 [Falco rusticolus]XP_055559778.1 tumor necrosis factor receptor superfamily member 14 [Falco cherrug]XP_055654578.1 tumor necrosis factor receptor superfamily member 14 [Falco peregrinus]XP_056188008.1 tumor necrosis factor receptor superfamily member 14 [Falco biarmicus]
MGQRPRAAPNAGRPLRRRGAPQLREPARRTMRLVFAVVLVMQLDCVEALECGLGEYPIGAECCLMCAAGLRVFKHCTANSSTMCVPCVEDTYTDHPNGLEHCRKCKLCDKGANLVPEVACTYTKNTVCGCPPEYFCSYLGSEDCELCQRYTVCFPGSMVKERGTKTTDNVCEACPPGTSSTANMSHSCIPWSKLKKNGWVQGENGNSSSASSVTVIVCSVVVAVLVIAVGLTSIWKWRKRKNYVPPVQESRSEQQSQALILTVEHTDQTTVPVQETGAGPEETSIE